MRAAALGLLLAAAPASANGFAVGAQSAEGLGMAGAVSAKPELWSAGFYNPSALPADDGTASYVGALVVDASFDIGDPMGGPDDANAREPTVIPHVFASYRAGQLGVVLFAGVPFGSGIAFADDWRGRHEVTDIALRAFAVNPNVVYQLERRVTVAAGVQYVRATLDYRTKIDLASDEASIHMGGAAHGIGITASVTYQPIDELAVAATYRSRTRLDFDGAADFDDVPMPFAGRLADQDLESTITLPDRVTLGGYWRVAPRVGVAADLEYTAWSTFEALTLDFAQDDLDQRVPRNWHDTISIRLGSEVDVAPAWRARGGLVFDPSVSPSDTLSPTTPDGDRYGLALGGSFRRRGLVVDVGYMLLAVASRSSSGDAFPATYRGRIHAGALSAGYRW